MTRRAAEARRAPWPERVNVSVSVDVPGTQSLRATAACNKASRFGVCWKLPTGKSGKVQLTSDADEPPAMLMRAVSGVASLCEHVNWTKAPVSTVCDETCMPLNCRETMRLSDEKETELVPGSRLTMPVEALSRRTLDGERSASDAGEAERVRQKSQWQEEHKHTHTHTHAH
jgi:hypothetical protein